MTGMIFWWKLIILKKFSVNKISDEKYTNFHLRVKIKNMSTPVIIYIAKVSWI